MYRCAKFYQNIESGSSEKRFRLLITDERTDGRTDSHSDYGANLRVVQYIYNTLISRPVIFLLFRDYYMATVALPGISAR